ncbi:MAG: DUF3149 domain-containing protein [Pseudomonadota bacterium]|nr:DUF3149 domain-containing protein [Pseudomonadota bacterium]
MDAVMNLLFNSPIGLLSLFTLGFIVAMGLFIWFKLAQKSLEH